MFLLSQVVGGAMSMLGPFVQFGSTLMVLVMRSVIKASRHVTSFPVCSAGSVFVRWRLNRLFFDQRL